MVNVELMEGLEILSVGKTVPIAISFILGILCLVVIALSIYVVIIAIQEGNLGATMIGLVLVGIAVFLSWVVIDETINPSSPTYKVLVSDTVSLNEFYNNYEILGVEGKIYTIEIKDDK